MSGSPLMSGGGGEGSPLRKGPWTPEEDDLLIKCIESYGEGNWTSVPVKAGEQEHSFFSTVILQSTEQYSTVLHCTTLYCTVLSCPVLYRAGCDVLS